LEEIMAERNMYRTGDSGGETIEFMLSPKHDLMAATLFPRLALSGGGPQPRVINVDEHPTYASAATDLRQTGELGHRVAAERRLI
jgi:IS6 family transposase